jgi:hypothetical protein
VKWIGLARKLQFVNGQWLMLANSSEKAQKNIMTESNVAFRIRRDLFVVEKIKNYPHRLETVLISRRVQLATPRWCPSLHANGGPHG